MFRALKSGVKREELCWICVGIVVGALLACWICDDGRSGQRILQ